MRHEAFIVRCDSGVLGLSPMARAAELKVIAGGSLNAVMKELAPPFEKSAAYRLSIHFDSTPNINHPPQLGTPAFDVVFVPIDVFKDADAKLRFGQNPVTDIARVGYGVIARAGASKHRHLHAGRAEGGPARRPVHRVRCLPAPPALTSQKSLSASGSPRK